VTWELEAPGPARNRQASFVQGDSLFLFGGNVSTGQHDFEPEHFTDQGARLDLATFEWSTVAPYPARRQTMSTLVTTDGTALSVGGFGHDGEVARTHPEIHAYDPIADRWTPRPGGLPGLGRTQLGLVEHGGALWVFGGLDYDPRRPKDDQFRHERSVLHAPLDEPGSALAPSGLELPQPRRAFASAMLGDRLYLIGGMREGFALVEDCEAFDFTTRSWQALPGPARPRLSAELVALGDRLYLAGGSSRAQAGGELASDRSIESFDPSTQTWSTLVEALPIETRHMRMLPWRDRLLVYNAHDEHGRVHVVMIDPGDGGTTGP
jgi:N-acetylneuraminic acid mutarotase